MTTVLQRPGGVPGLAEFLHKIHTEFQGSNSNTFHGILLTSLFWPSKNWGTTELQVRRKPYGSSYFYPDFTRKISTNKRTNHRRLKFCPSNILKMSKYKNYEAISKKLPGVQAPFRSHCASHFLRNGLQSVLICDIMIYLRTELQAPVDKLTKCNISLQLLIILSFVPSSFSYDMKVVTLPHFKEVIIYDDVKPFSAYKVQSRTSPHLTT